MMFGPSRHAIPMMAIYYAAVLATFNSRAVVESATTRRRELAILHSDEYTESVLTVQSSKVPVGFNAQEHAKISSMLETTKEMMDTANALVRNQKTMAEGRKMRADAMAMFRQLKSHIHQMLPISNSIDPAKAQHDINRELLRKKYMNHNVAQSEEDEERALDVHRRIYETVITFPECLEQLFENCLSLVNTQAQELGLDPYEIVIHEKRNIDQPGYNKVVIVTDMLGELVMGRLGDGIVTYPFQWDDAVLGPRTLSVDGKWNCLGYTPEDCCNSIKQSVPNPNTKGDDIACHIFVPYGGVGNPKRQDRIIINVSPDGRVQEPPIIT